MTGAALFPDAAASVATRGGILPSQRITALIERGAVRADAPIGEEQIQPASLDLRLGNVAHRVRASFLPGERAPVARKIDTLKMHTMDLSAGAVLERDCVYVVPLQESLQLPKGISARANAKSSTGRLDVFTRLITDYSAVFDQVAKGYRGQLYVEIAPRTFTVLARAGDCLNQLRFSRGAPAYSGPTLARLDADRGLVYREDAPAPAHIEGGLRVGIDLAGVEGSNVAGYRARQHSSIIEIAKLDYYDMPDYWDVILTSHDNSVVLEPDAFHLFVSKEKIRVPPDHAAEMVAYDPSVGEFRVHYAGFFDPGFGHGAEGEIEGTRAVLEVRSHEVPFLLEDGQIVGRLIYEPLSEMPAKVYGPSIGSKYQDQGLALAKQFKRT